MIEKQIRVGIAADPNRASECGLVESNPPAVSLAISPDGGDCHAGGDGSSELLSVADQNRCGTGCTPARSLSKKKVGSALKKMVG